MAQKRVIAFRPLSMYTCPIWTRGMHRQRLPIGLLMHAPGYAASSSFTLLRGRPRSWPTLMSFTILTR
jgi:hypothetical protein